LLMTGVHLLVSRGTVASLITERDAMVKLLIVRVSYVDSVLGWGPLLRLTRNPKK
jgi:hypothetical protein